MKSLVLLFSIVLSFSSCSQNDERENLYDSIIGTWKLTEVLSSDGGSNPQWVKIENGYTYTFNKDSSFISNRFDECQSGNFSISSDHLILNYDCENFTTGIESPAGTFKENYININDEIILKPTYLGCFEGCGNKFIKIQSE